MPKRVKVIFDDSISNIDPNLYQKSWLLIPDNLKLISDLCYAVLQQFQLQKACPNGINLYLEDCMLPATQDVALVRENDTISVQKALQKRSRESNSSSDDSSSEEETNHKAKKQKQEVPKAKVPAPPPPPAPRLKALPAPKPTPKPTPKATPKPQPKKVESSSEESSSEEEELSTKPTPKATPKQQPPKATPTPPKISQQTVSIKTVAPKVTPPPKGHFKFDAEGNILELPGEPKLTPPQSNGRGNGRGKHIKPPKSKDKDFTKNVSLVFQNPDIMKPVRDYNTFALLAEDDLPGVGDVISFYITELVGWQPLRNLKEATVLSIDVKNTNIQVKIHDAFLNPREEEEETEEPKEPQNIFVYSRADMAEIRIINKKQ